MEIVFVVKEYAETICVENLTGEIDNGTKVHGICKTIEIADKLIEKKVKTKLDKAMSDGNGAWVSAYPGEPVDVEDIGYPVTRKTIMIYDRRTGDAHVSEFWIIVERVTTDINDIRL